jgi:multiple sugar transport system substrate-binding protein
MEETMLKLSSNFPATLSRRSFIATSALAAGSLCAPYVRAQGATTLRLMNTETAIASIEVLKKITADYKRLTGVNVVFDNVPSADEYPKLLSAMRSGSPYDIAVLAFIGDVILCADQNLLVPMNELVDQYQWGPKILFPYKGNKYWYPYDYNLCMIYYRKDLYKAKGLHRPNTWAEYLSNAEKLRTNQIAGCMHPTANTGATPWMSTGFHFAEGVKVLDDNLNVVFDKGDNGKKAIAALDYFVSLYPTMPAGMAQASWAQALGLFSSAQVAHAPYSGRMIEILEDKAPQIAEQAGAFPFMDSTGKHKALTHGYDGFVVMQTPRAEESMKFMQWFAKERFIDWLHAAPVHMQPCRLDIYDDPRWLDNPMLKKHADLVAEMRGFLTRSDVTIDSIDTQGATTNLKAAKVFASLAFNEMLQNATLKRMPSAEAVSIAAEKMRRATAG